MRRGSSATPRSTASRPRPASRGSSACSTSHATSSASGSSRACDDPTKIWKFNEGDLAERARWDDYQAAYQDALARCDTDAAPWYVIPADRKWYRNWAIQQLLLETLRELDPQYPKREDLDVPALEKQLKAS